MPAVDSQPGESGTDTDQISLVRAEHNGGGATGFCCGTDFTEVTPRPASNTPAGPTGQRAAALKKCNKIKKKKAKKKCKRKANLLPV
jgi:hypothetical protein